MIGRRKKSLAVRQTTELLLAELRAVDSIDAWLAVLMRLLRLPDPCRRLIREELHEHLTERVRDLLLSGCTEAQAIRTAIGELGEIAQLARRFEAANRPRARRIVMNVLLPVVTSAAVAMGIIALKPPTDSVGSHAPWPQSQAMPSEIADARITVSESASIRQVLNEIAQQANLGLIVDWTELEESGLDPDMPLNLTLAKARIPDILDSFGNPQLAWRFQNEAIVLGLRHEIDRRESTLASYDIADVLDLLHGNYQRSYDDAVTDVSSLVIQMVEPELWIDNGGQVASLRVVGGKMFIQAPPRMHQQVEWIVQQLKQNIELTDAKTDPALPLLRDLPLLERIEEASDSQPKPVGELPDEIKDLQSLCANTEDALHHARLAFHPTSEQVLRLEEQLANAKSRLRAAEAAGRSAATP